MIQLIPKLSCINMKKSVSTSRILMFLKVEQFVSTCCDSVLLQKPLTSYKIQSWCVLPINAQSSDGHEFIFITLFFTASSISHRLNNNKKLKTIPQKEQQVVHHRQKPGMAQTLRQKTFYFFLLKLVKLIIYLVFWDVDINKTGIHVKKSITSCL